MSEKPKLTVVLPVFNEESNLKEMYSELSKVLAGISEHYEILFVNDGSSDKSESIIKSLAREDKNLSYINLSRNFGQQLAISAGLEHSSGERVAIMDADFQDPPELLPEMFAKLDEGFDVVYGKRNKRTGEPFMKRFTAKMFYRILSKLTTVDIPLDTGDFRMMKRKVVDVLNQMPEKDKFIRGQVAWIGFKQTHICFEREGRSEGKTGYSYKKMLRFAFDGVTSFSDFPLRFATYLGFLVSTIAFLIMLWALYQRFIVQEYVQGWTSLILSVLFLGGVQLISLGIIGEYISRIGSNVRNRPNYVVSEKHTQQEGS